MSRRALEPPRIARWLLALVAPPSDAHFIASDLHEEMQTRAESSGAASARRWYWRQVLTSIPSLLRLRFLAEQRSSGSAADILAQDAAFAVRRIASRPGFALIGIVTLALAIAAATAIFTIVDGVLLRPLPFRNASALLTIWQSDTTYRVRPTLRSRWNRLWFTYPEFQRVSGKQRSLGAVALYGDQQMTLTGVGEPAELNISTATPALLDVLGENVALGRWFLPSEVGTNSERIAVITYEIWQARFGADASILNRSITLDEKPFRIVGVLRPGFRLASLSNPMRASGVVWIPLGSDGGGQAFDSSYEMIARLRTDVPLSAASSELDALAREASGRTERGARVLRRLDAETAAVKQPLALLAVGAGLLLFIACANVAMLLLGEAPSRRQEFATRRAVGASSSRLLRQLLTESGLLAVTSGVLGAILAGVAVRVLVAMAPVTMPRIDDVAVNARVLFFCIVLVGVATVVFGLIPAAVATRERDAATLRVHGGGMGIAERRLQNVVVGAQVVTGIMLLAGAAALTSSLRKLTAVDAGLRPDGVVTLSITLPRERYQTPARVLQYFDAVEQRLRAIPGVRSVGATSNLPFSERNQTTGVQLDESTPADERPNVQRRVVRAGYFATVGIPVIAGRPFASDASDPRDAIVVDAAFAGLLWPNDVAVGKRFKTLGAWFTVIGVVGSAHHTRLDEDVRPTFYVPQSSIGAREMTMVMRVDGDPRARLDAFRQAVWLQDPTIAVGELEPLAERVARSMSSEAYRTTLLDLFAVFALLLTAVGVFGVTIRAVAQRTRELGIRVALGADLWSIAKTLLRDQVASVGVGLCVGLAGAMAVAPWLRSLTFNTSAADPALLGGAALLLLVATVCAALPALRLVARVDPSVVMRDS